MLISELMLYLFKMKALCKRKRNFKKIIKSEKEKNNPTKT